MLSAASSDDASRSRRAGLSSPSALALIEALGLRVVLVPLDAEQAAK